MAQQRAVPLLKPGGLSLIPGTPVAEGDSHKLSTDPHMCTMARACLEVIKETLTLTAHTWAHIHMPPQRHVRVHMKTLGLSVQNKNKM